MVAFIQKAHGCIFFCYAIKAQAAQLAISDSRSVLQEPRSNQGPKVLLLDFRLFYYLIPTNLMFLVEVRGN